MSFPKFSVGEVVILQSKSNPECNGEYTVDLVRQDGQEYPDRLTGKFKRCTFIHGKYGYVLSPCPMIRQDGCEVSWAESSLRKRHQPGEMSFNRLMQDLMLPARTSLPI